MLGMNFVIRFFATNTASRKGLNESFVSLHAHMTTVNESDGTCRLAKSKKQFTQLLVF